MIARSYAETGKTYQVAHIASKWHTAQELLFFALPCRRATQGALTLGVLRVVRFRGTEQKTAAQIGSQVGIGRLCYGISSWTVEGVGVGLQQGHAGIGG